MILESYYVTKGYSFHRCVAVTSSGKAAFKVFTEAQDGRAESASFDKIVQLNVTCHQEIVDISFTSKILLRYIHIVQSTLD